MKWALQLWIMLTGSRFKALQLEGRRLLRAKRYSGALAVYRRLVAEWPEEPVGHQGLSDLFQAMGLVEESRREAGITEALRTLATKPDDLPSRLRLAKEFQAAGMSKAALAHMEHALRLGRPGQDVLRLAATILRYNSQFNKAIELVQQALGQEPLAIDLYEQLTFNLRALGRQLEAAKARNLVKSLKAAQQEPGSPEVLEKAIFQLTVSGRREQALPLLERSLAGHPDVCGLHVLRGELLLEAGQPGPALKTLQRAVELEATTAKAHALLARALEVLGQAEAAAGHRDIVQEIAAARTERDHLGSELGLVGVLLKCGQHQKALERADNMLSLYGEDWRSHYLMGLVQNAMGKHQEAMDSLRKAVHVFDKAPEVFFAMARLQAEFGRNEDAISQARHAVSLAPRQPWVRLEMASLLDDLGLAELAREERDMAQAIVKRQAMQE
ncbi:MAG: tetratricopeptide repeat protein [Pseudomonadota bacterium]